MKKYTPGYPFWNVFSQIKCRVGAVDTCGKK